MYLFLQFLGYGCSHSLQPLPSNFISAFKDTHRRIYDVYAVDLERDAIHNLLAQSFRGEALTQEYIEHYTTRLKMQEEETSIHIRKVDYNSLEIITHRLDGVRIDADWSVGGIVTHQKHKHPRVNRYRAVYSLQPDAASQWKIVDTKLCNLQRVQRAVLSDDELCEGRDAGGGYLDPLDLIGGGLSK